MNPDIFETTDLFTRIRVDGTFYHSEEWFQKGAVRFR